MVKAMYPILRDTVSFWKPSLIQADLPESEYALYKNNHQIQQEALKELDFFFWGTVQRDD